MKSWSVLKRQATRLPQCKRRKVSGRTAECSACSFSASPPQTLSLAVRLPEERQRLIVAQMLSFAVEREENRVREQAFGGDGRVGDRRFVRRGKRNGWLRLSGLLDNGSGFNVALEISREHVALILLLLCDIRKNWGIIAIVDQGARRARGGDRIFHRGRGMIRFVDLRAEVRFVEELRIRFGEHVVFQIVFNSTMIVLKLKS